jgi:5-methylcytosine-specific restriction enzyme A
VRFCLEQRCRQKAIYKGRCDDCNRKKEQQRGTSRERGYTSQWDAFSVIWRKRYPLCGMRADGQLYTEHSLCVQQGLTVLAQCVDHMDGHARVDDRATFYNEERLQSLCLRCNTVKEQRGHG